MPESEIHPPGFHTAKNAVICSLLRLIHMVVIILLHCYRISKFFVTYNPFRYISLITACACSDFLFLYYLRPIT